MYLEEFLLLPFIDDCHRSGAAGRINAGAVLTVHLNFELDHEFKCPCVLSVPLEDILDVTTCPLRVLFEIEGPVDLGQHPLDLLAEALEYRLLLRAVTEFDVHF
jgi:hypothetical protein